MAHMRCPDCGFYEFRWADTGVPDPENPGETISVMVCGSCDKGVELFEEIQREAAS